MISRLLINDSSLHNMIKHASDQAPLETCGLLAGKGNRVEKVLLVTNQAQSPVRFVMSPKEQLDAFKWIESNDLELLGIFHSHPTGLETVSATDIAEVAYEVVHIILSQKSDRWKARGFWIEKDQAREVTLQIMK